MCDKSKWKVHDRRDLIEIVGLGFLPKLNGYLDENKRCPYCAISFELKHLAELRKAAEEIAEYEEARKIQKRIDGLYPRFLELSKIGCLQPDHD